MISLLGEYVHVTGIVTIPFDGETGLDVKKLEEVAKLKSGSLGVALPFPNWCALSVEVVQSRSFPSL